MRVQALLAVLLLGAVMFAGCSSGGSDDASPSTTGSSTGTSSKSGTSTGSQTNSTGLGNQTGNQTGNGTNRAPAITLAASPTNGSSPLNVTFNFTVTDPDGDDVTWVLSYGDNESLPGNSTVGNSTHRYGAAGNYTVTFNVTDSRGMTATANATIQVAAAGGSAPTGTVVVATWQVGAGPTTWQYELQNCRPSPGDGVTSKSFTLPPAALGRPYVATIAAAQGGAAIVSWGFIVSDPGCGTADADYDSKSATGGPTPITGTLGKTWTYGAVYASGGQGLTMKMTFS